jgi:hypothetical protein
LSWCNSERINSAPLTVSGILVIFKYLFAAVQHGCRQ